MNEESKTKLINIAIVVFILLPLIFIFIYFYNFRDEKLSNLTQDFANFGNYISAALTFATISIILYFNTKNEELLTQANSAANNAAKLSNEANELAKENLDEMLRIEKIKSIRDLINDAAKKMDSMLQSEVRVIEYIRLIVSAGFLDSSYVQGNKEKLKTMEQSELLKYFGVRPMTVEALFNTVYVVFTQTHKMTKEEAYVSIRDLLNEYETQLGNIGHCYKQFDVYAIQYKKFLLRYSELGADMNELNYHTIPYKQSIYHFGELCYVKKSTYNIMKMLSLLIKLVDKGKLIEMQFHTLYYKFENAIIDKGQDPEDYLLKSMKIDGDKLLLECRNFINQDLMNREIFEVEMS